MKLREQAFGVALALLGELGELGRNRSPVPVARVGFRLFSRGAWRGGGGFVKMRGRFGGAGGRFQENTSGFLDSCKSTVCETVTVRSPTNEG